MFFLKKSFGLALILLLACGCTQKDFGTRHHNYTLGASLCIPSNWQRLELDPTAELLSMAFEDGEEGVVILTQNYGVGFKKQLKVTAQINYPTLDNGSLLFSKYKTKWFFSDKDKVTYMTYVLKDKQGRVFSVICASPSINFVSYRDLFEKIARSFVSY